MPIKLFLDPAKTQLLGQSTSWQGDGLKHVFTAREPIRKAYLNDNEVRLPAKSSSVLTRPISPGSMDKITCTPEIGIIAREKIDSVTTVITLWATVTTKVHLICQETLGYTLGPVSFSSSATGSFTKCITLEAGDHQIWLEVDFSLLIKSRYDYQILAYITDLLVTEDGEFRHPNTSLTEGGVEVYDTGING